MSKYSEFVKKQETFLEEIEISRNGINHELYCELVNLDRSSVSRISVQGEIKKHEEYGKEYNLYREEGFAYKYTLVFLCDFLLNNGFQLPETVLEKHSLFQKEMTFYKTLLEAKGKVDFSTIKYILSIDLGLREQMKELFGDQIINNETFPRYEDIKQKLETIKEILNATKKRHTIVNYTPEEIKNIYINTIGQRLDELQAQLLEMKDKIQKQGVFTIDTHPQYRKIEAEYNELMQKRTRIQAMVEPEEIELLRTELLEKIVDYKGQYEELKTGKIIKGVKDKETLESEKEIYQQNIQSLSPGGNIFKRVSDDMNELNSNVKQYSDSKLVLAELENLLKRYDQQHEKHMKICGETQTKSSELEALKQEYEETATSYFKMTFIQKHMKKGKQNESKRLELRKKERSTQEQLNSSKEMEQQEQAKLDIIRQEILNKIELLQKNDAKKQYFQPNNSIQPISFPARLEEFRNCIKELSNSLDNLSKNISDSRADISRIISIAENSITEETVNNKIAQIITEEQKKIDGVEKGLNYVKTEEEQPSYYDNLEIGVELAEEEISHRRK